MELNSSIKKKKKMNKRKQLSHEEELIESPSKKPFFHCLEKKVEESLQDNGPWTNLQLILSLQNKKIQTLTKLELAFSYVQSRIGEAGGSSQDAEMLSDSRVVVFLNNWVQGVLIASWKQIKDMGNGHQLQIHGSCFDYRCWVIFIFCLEGHQKLHASLSFPRHLLEVFHYVVRDELCRLNGEMPHVKEPVVGDKELEHFLQIVTNCVSLVFSSHGSFTNANLALWVSVVSTVLKLIQKVFLAELYCNDMGAILLQLSYYLLEPFAKFLRVHPAKNNDFCYFIDELLEPLLHLLDVSSNGIKNRNSGLRKNVHKMIEEVLLQGIFHPSQIDGFLSLRCSLMYKSTVDTKTERGLIGLKSYHKHLFEKLKKIISEKNIMALGGVGEMFHCLVKCIRKQKGGGTSSEASTVMDLGSVPNTVKNSSSNDKGLVKSSGLDAETRISVFDFFVQIMQFFISEADFFDEAELSGESTFEDIFCILRSINCLLASFLNEKIYTRTEDISEGACLVFFKVLYDKITSFSDKFFQFWLLYCGSGGKELWDILFLIAKEILVSVRHLLDIEYDVVGDDLGSLWGILLSYTSCGHLLIDSPSQSLLTDEILQLGCKIVDLYHELRQVNTSLSALCKALRLLISPQRISEVLLLPQYHGSFANSLSSFLCSMDFRHSVCTAIKSIPEGQASGCIQQLIEDVSETFDWLKVYGPSSAEDGSVDPCPTSSGSACLTLQIKLMETGILELYTLVLDSIIVTPGNSYPVGRSMKDLMEVLRPLFSLLVSPKLGSVHDFLCKITGKSFNYHSKNLNTHGIITFFFRLYLCWRSLFRQVISVMPPDSSKKMLIEMGDMLTSCSGMDWVQKTSLINEGYFCWVSHLSDTLPNVLHAVSDLYLEDNISDCSSLVYVLSAMTLQRLVDLSMLIKSIEYLIQQNDYLIESKLVGDTSLSQYRKRNKKWKKFLTDMRIEAACLTETLMKCLWSLPEDQFSMQEHTWDFSVGTLDKVSLPTALWCIICHNVDIWCTHASKKDLRKFLSYLIKSSVPFKSSYRSEKNETIGYNHKKVIVHDISLSLLSDINFYEQKFVRRHMASIFQDVLENTVPSIFLCVGEVDLNSGIDWEEALRVLENPSAIVLAKDSLRLESTSHLSGPSSVETYQKEQSHLQRCSKFAICLSILGFLTRMPKGHLSLKSFRRFATCILNLERLTVNHLLGSGHNLCNEQLVLLFLSCRRTLKNLFTASCEAKMEGGQSSLCSILMEDPSNVLWLSKSLSAVIELHHAFPEGTITGIEDTVLPVMDQTSSLFFYLSKNQFEHAIYSQISDWDTEGENISNAIDQEEADESGGNQLMNCLDDHSAWENLAHLVECMREHMHNSIAFVQKASVSPRSSFLSDIKILKRLSCVMACFQGFLWGLASTLDKIDAIDDKFKKRLSGCKVNFIGAINICTNTCTEFVNCFIPILLFEDGNLPRNLPSVVSHISVLNKGMTGTGEASPKKCTDNDGLDGKSKRKCESTTLSLCSGEEKTSNNEEFEAMLIKMEDEQKYFRRSLLQGLLRGDNIESAIFLRQLFFASSACLRFNFQINRISSSWDLTPSLISLSELLLLEFSRKTTLPQSVSYLWLNGVVKFLEQFGSYLPLVDPSLSRGLYAKLIDLHLVALGRCISLQGKRATLASQESESSTKMLNCPVYSEHTIDKKAYGLNELKYNLRTSFVVYIKESSKLHLAYAVEAVERAIVGTCQGSIIDSEIHTGGLDGGKVSMTVASGIYCVDLILEYVTGRKHLSLVKSHIHNFVASLFNVLLHLQGPNIFYQKVYDNPDPGSVVLMCINVLSRVFGKPSLFQMEASHVAQYLCVPASLLQNLSHIRTLDAPDLPLASSTGDAEGPSSANGFVVDRHFSVEIYAACCQLLSTVLKHHKSETQRCFALLQDSVGVLLCCLEMVGAVPVSRKYSFSFELQEGVKCATYLRRVYEEMRQQKDVFGNKCFQLLSKYIWVYCGYGPLKTGITREIDEALRPGVYALIDTCSSDDLQRLHTDFGEGPCRSTLANLQHDYKIYFQYEGKV
ncbi:hypothetical protein Leryth_016997 [Lithospermum erythrorhizon]|nr:hypothetical protein Leryth_016997 [Lithospermum erythrorhizon]